MAQLRQRLQQVLHRLKQEGLPMDSAQFVRFHPIAGAPADGEIDMTLLMERIQHHGLTSLVPC